MTRRILIKKKIFDTLECKVINNQHERYHKIVFIVIGNERICKICKKREWPAFYIRKLVNTMLATVEH